MDSIMVFFYFFFKSYEKNSLNQYGYSIVIGACVNMLLYVHKANGKSLGVVGCYLCSNNRTIHSAINRQGLLGAFFFFIYLSKYYENKKKY